MTSQEYDLIVADCDCNHMGQIIKIMNASNYYIHGEYEVIERSEYAEWLSFQIEERNGNTIFAIRWLKDWVKNCDKPSEYTYFYRTGRGDDYSGINEDMYECITACLKEYLEEYWFDDRKDIL